MATHALIALQSHSSFHAAYLHFDGTPENLRPILHQHFNTIGKIKELIQPGAPNPFPRMVKQVCWMSMQK